jgi:ComF family protein
MNVLNFILRVLFPPRCLICGVPLSAGVICASCFDRIPRHQTFFCAVCGARLPERKKICHRGAFYLLAAAGQYDDPALRALVHALKFHGVRQAAEPIAELIARYLVDTGTNLEGYLVIPLPLHPRRRNERGFNQTEEIARHLARRISLEVRTDILTRNRHTRPQTGMAGAEERRRNIAGCFSVAHPEDIRGRNIVVLDDVATSGATMGEASRMLKAAGARRIIGLAAARA